MRKSPLTNDKIKLNSHELHQINMSNQHAKLDQGCHWSFVKITENLRVRAVSQKMNSKTDRKFRKRKMKYEKIEKTENGKRIGGEQIRPKIMEKNGK